MNSFSKIQNDSPSSTKNKLKKITSFDVVDMKSKEQYFRFLLRVQTGFSTQSTSEKLCMKRNLKNSDTKVRHLRSSSSYLLY